MPRNLDHRVEILFPLADDKLVARVRDELLKCYLSDTANARRMLSDGAYVRKKARQRKARAQLPGQPGFRSGVRWRPHDSARDSGVKATGRRLIARARERAVFSGF
jgi:hypothetical protein